MNTKYRISSAFSMALVVFSGLVLLACSPGTGGGLAQLDGTWQVDTEQTSERMSQEQRDEVGPMIGLLGSLSFAFDTAARTMTIGMMGMEEIESFQVLSSDGDTIVLVPEGDEEDETITIRFLDRDTIEVTDQSDAETPTMIMVRQ